MRVRAALSQDCAAVLAVEAAAFPTPAEAKLVAALLDDLAVAGAWMVLKTRPGLPGTRGHHPLH